MEGANSVWHIDGNHKMIRWRIVVYGGIDGYSRLIAFLKCHTDNKSTSVLSAFRSGVDKYGLPSLCVQTTEARTLESGDTCLKNAHQATV